MRTGRITASRCADFMTNGKGEMFGETAKTYAKELVCDRLGIERDEVTTWQMEWGIEHEPDARQIYENSRQIKVHLPGFIEFGTNAGCTPDGVIMKDETPIGLLEIKCPQWKAYIDYLITKQPPKDYWQQMQFQMMVTGALWCDWMIYHPNFPDHLKAKVFRIERDQDYIDLIESRLQPFEELIQLYIKALSE